MDDNNKDLLKFSLSIYGDIAAYNEVLSKLDAVFFINMAIGIILILLMNLLIS